MFQLRKTRMVLACSTVLMTFILTSLTAAIAGDAKISVLRDNAAEGGFSLQIYNPPEGLDGEPSQEVAEYTNINNTILDAAGGDVYGSDNDNSEFVVLAENTSGVNSLSIFEIPAEGTAGIGKPVAGDNRIGRRGEFITVGDFDADPELEVAVIRSKRNGKFKLLIYNLPKVPGGNTGRAIVSDVNIGTGITALCSGNFDSDSENELVIVRKVNEHSELQIYDVPQKRRGSIGEPLLSYVDIERDITLNGLAVGEFDTHTADARIALVFSEQDNSSSLEIFDLPQVTGEQLPPAIASYSDIGSNIVTIASMHMVTEDNTHVNEAPKAAIRADMLSGQAPLTVFFDGRESYDSDGFIQSYQWSFENEDIGANETLDYEFTESGTHKMTLTVTDNEGARQSAWVSIEVTGPANDDTPESDLHPEEEELVSLINAFRQENGLSPLSHASALGSAARRHSDDMAQNNFMSHTGSDGSSPWQRMDDAGYQYYTAGENVAAGQTSPEGVATAWMNSSGHRANILNPDFCEIGAGYAYAADSYYRHYWTLDFGCSR